MCHHLHKFISGYLRWIVYFGKILYRFYTKVEDYVNIPQDISVLLKEGVRCKRQDGSTRDCAVQTKFSGSSFHLIDDV